MAKRLPDRIYRVIGFVGTSRVVTRLHPHVYRLTGGRGPIGRNFGVQNVIVTMTFWTPKFRPTNHRPPVIRYTRGWIRVMIRLVPTIPIARYRAFRRRVAMAAG